MATHILDIFASVISVLMVVLLARIVRPSFIADVAKRKAQHNQNANIRNYQGDKRTWSVNLGSYSIGFPAFLIGACCIGLIVNIITLTTSANYIRGVLDVEKRDMAIQLKAASVAVERAEAMATLAADEGYAAASSVNKEMKIIPAHSIGYVYLGKFNEVWISRQFKRLPSSCNVKLPSEGQSILSWYGAVVHDSLPNTLNGSRKYGNPIGRVNAGFSVVLHSVHPIGGLLPGSGPQYCWGKIEVSENIEVSPGI